MDKFPTLHLLLRHRGLAVIVAALVPLLLGAYLAWRLSSVDIVVVAIVLAAALTIVVRALIELVAIVVETLMPTV